MGSFTTRGYCFTACVSSAIGEFRSASSKRFFFFFSSLASGYRCYILSANAKSVPIFDSDCALGGFSSNWLYFSVAIIARFLLRFIFILLLSWV